jgi:hypothetical protein
MGLSGSIGTFDPTTGADGGIGLMTLIKNSAARVFVVGFLIAILIFSGRERIPLAPRIGNPDLAAIRQRCGEVFQNAMLTPTAESKSVSDALSRLCKRDMPLGFNPLDPANVWAFGRSGEQSLTLVLERSYVDGVPGSTSLCLILLDQNGRMLSESKFTAGRRTFLNEGHLCSVDGCEFPVIETKMDSWLTTRSRQWYAFVGERFDLIRVEGNNGTAERNYYNGYRCDCGPAPPKQSEEKWVADLLSNDRARSLRALVWMGSERHTMGTEHRALPDIALARNVRERPAVQSRLRILAATGPTWEREQAALALAGDDYR